MQVGLKRRESANIPMAIWKLHGCSVKICTIEVYFCFKFELVKEQPCWFTKAEKDLDGLVQRTSVSPLRWVSAAQVSVSFKMG